jgi:serine/threonine protein kinase
MLSSLLLNVVECCEGHVRVTDFGLSKEGLLSHSDRTNTFCGTPAYLGLYLFLRLNLFFF